MLGVPGRVRVFKTTLNDVRDLHGSRIATAIAYVCAPTRREAARLFGVVDAERITEAHIEKGLYVLCRPARRPHPQDPDVTLASLLTASTSSSGEGEGVGSLSK